MLLRIFRRLCRHPKKWMLRNIFQVFFLSILSILILVALLAYLTSTYISTSANDREKIGGGRGGQSPFLGDINRNITGSTSQYPYHSNHLKLIPLNSAPIREVQSSSIRKSQELRVSLKEERRLASEVMGGWSKCSMHNCFDIHRCGMNGRQTLSIYIYPIEKFVVDGRPLYDSDRSQLSREFYEFLDAIRRSPFYVPNPSEACVFIPSIDLMALGPRISFKDLEAALSSLQFWEDNGQNHILFSMFPGNSSLLSLNTEAVIASSGFPVESYRLGFHVPLISYNGLLRNYISTNRTNSFNNLRDQNIVAISPQGQLPPHLIEDDSILVLDICTHKKPINYLTRCRGSQMFEYPEVLNTVDFCIVVKDLSGPTLWDIMRVGCIPVIIADFQRLPFDEVIDWKKNAIILYENQIPQLSSILQSVSEKRRRKLKSHSKFTFNKYFKSIHHITKTLLQVIHDRVFSHSAKTLEEWNYNRELEIEKQPLFNPVIAPNDSGFTAVILAYERIPSLFQVIERVSLVPSVAKIIVVWNNQVKQPPPYSTWPKTTKPIKVIQMDNNLMSNRFYPFEEIETEAVFSLDDDIIMLTVDEIEFGFEAWREYPDRIVGFPSRSHVWDNSSRRWKYDSEWTNEISMVLTGAAFYHKYWHHAYTNEMSLDIRQWVDAKMNCEDIAMNFLVSAKTKKAPIKVTPRKKFKCPTCSNNEMLSSDSSHMVERTDCINKFVQIYGYMPLMSAEYRVDPVLYKVDGLPKRLKKFSDVGSL